MPKVVFVSLHEMRDRRTVQQMTALEAAGYETQMVDPYWEENTSSFAREKTASDDTVQQKSRFDAALDSLSSLPAVQKTARPLLAFIQKRMDAARERRNDSAQGIEARWNALLLDKALHTTADVYQACDLCALPAAVKAAKRCGAKVVYDSHELYYERGQRDSLRRGLRKIETKYVKSTDVVMTVNPSMAQLFAERYSHENCCAIMNKYDLEFAESSNDDPYIEFELPPARKILLFQGGVFENRNVGTLIDMMRFLRHGEAVLFIVGNGDAVPSFKARVEQSGLGEKVFFVPSVPQKELFCYTAHADIGLIAHLPLTLNLKYMTPLKLFEYIAAGLPIASSDTPELRRVVEKEKIGCMIDFTDPEKAAKGIDAMLDDESELARMKVRLGEIKQEYSWYNESKKYVELFDTLIKE